MSLQPNQRLIVSIDFTPQDPENPKRGLILPRIYRLLDQLMNTSVIVKFNSILRAVGYDLIDVAHDYDLKVFADLKLCDIKQTLGLDGLFLKESKPEIVTVMAQAGIEPLQALKGSLPLTTEVLGITVLTTFNDSSADEMFRCGNVERGVKRFGSLIAEAGLDGGVCAPKEIETLREVFGPERTINTPNIRPIWHRVANDDQNKDRSMTIGDAIRAGATRLVMGRPIVEAADPYAAVMRTLDEIAAAS